MRKLEKILKICLPIIAFVVVASVMIGCSQKTIEEKNKALAYRWIDEVWNKGNPAAVDKLVTTNFVFNYAPPGVTSNLEGYKQTVSMWCGPLADVHCTVEDMVAQGDKVGVRWIWGGTHASEYMGIAPTGKQLTVTGISVLRIEDGKIVEELGAMDNLGMMQQLGLAPAMEREDFSWGKPMTRETGVPTDSEKTKALYLRELEMWNQGDLDIANEVFAENFVNHDPSWLQVVDLASYKQWASDMFASAPDMNFTVDFLIVEGNKVAGRWIGDWTDTGGMAGKPPTGKQITVTGIDIIRCADGKIVERWWAKDILGVMQQLGVISPPAPPSK